MPSSWCYTFSDMDIIVDAGYVARDLCKGILFFQMFLHKTELLMDMDFNIHGQAARSARRLIVV